MQLLADMQPKFLRFPGGNYLEGNTIERTLQLEENHRRRLATPRPSQPVGLLVHRRLRLAGISGLVRRPAHGAGARGVCRLLLAIGKHVEPGPNLEPYVQDALDEIEYVTGDTNTKWGAQRAKDGHPAPFKLTYVEIGNEDWFDRSGSYDGRFAQFYDAIKAKYPQSASHFHRGYEHPRRRWFTAARRIWWTNIITAPRKRCRRTRLTTTSIRARTRRRFSVGEWATRVGSPTPNMAGALGDAAWMTGMERNSDIVLMSCYAPLFVNVSQIDRTEAARCNGPRT